MSTYNGWTNWQTWAVNLHMDATFADIAETALKGYDVEELSEENNGVIVSEVANMFAEAFWEALEYDSLNLLQKELLNVADVNFEEIAEHYVSDYASSL